MRRTGLPGRGGADRRVEGKRRRRSKKEDEEEGTGESEEAGQIEQGGGGVNLGFLEKKSKVSGSVATESYISEIWPTKCKDSSAKL